MSLETWTDEQLEELDVIARAASPGEWAWGQTPTKTVNAAVRWAAKSIRQSDSPGLWELYIGVPEDPKLVANCGNGPTSEANCKYLNCVQPRNIHALVADLLRARRQIALLEAEDELREQLAALAHEQWSGWVRYQFSKCEERGDGRLIPPWAVERWMRQMQTVYADLPEEEKESDRTEADKVLALIRA